MKFYYLLSWIMASSTSVTSAVLRGSYQPQQHQAAPQTIRRVKTPVTSDTCAQTSIVDVQYEDHTKEESYVSCETSDGKSYKVNGINSATVRANKRSIIAGLSEVDLPAGAEMNGATGEIDLPPGLAAKFKKKPKGGRNNNSGNSHNNGMFNRQRNLAVTGQRSVLIVRVIAGDASTTASVERLSDSVFGNNADEDGADTVTLRSQYLDCSYNQLEFVPTNDRVGVSTNITNGAVTITVPSNTTDGDSVMSNDIVNELSNQFGMSASNLANHVMMCLPPGSMSGIAYANVGSWRSVYKDNWCTYLSTQVHEIGHNINLAHSNEGGTYKDQSGMMGYSYSQDNGPNMCFNGAKSWQLGWYTSRHKEFSKTDIPGSWNGRLIGQVDYENPNLQDQDKVLVKLNRLLADTDYFVQFNRKPGTGTNSGTVEGGNQVMIVRAGAEGNGYYESELLAKLGAGGAYTWEDFDISGLDLTLTVNSIDLNVNPPFANITLLGGCNANVQCDDGIECNGAETCDVDTARCLPGIPLIDPDAACCGNGICEVSKDESSSSCSLDCTICDDPGNEGSKLLQVNVLTDRYPAETSWTLVNTCTGGMQQTNPSYGAQYTQYSNDYCIPDAQAYTFTINDSYNDGLCCGFGEGRYSLAWGLDSIKYGGSFSSSEATSFGECGVLTPAPSRSPTPPEPSKSPTKAPTDTPSSKPPSASPTTPPPTPSPTKSPTDSPIPAPTRNPTMNPTTAEPTPPPTTAPTSPTAAPTPVPSRSPTKEPTNEPTMNPTTANPTLSPTNAPTDLPSPAPTALPTTSPTLAPSHAPTKAPQAEPTMNPTTADPTSSPTAPPTNPPTPSPTQSPTLPPTPNPTNPPLNCPQFTRPNLCNLPCEWVGGQIKECHDP